MKLGTEKERLLIGERLEKLMKLRDINQPSLAAKAGCKQSAVSKMVNGKGGSLDILLRFAVALNVPISLLVYEKSLSDEKLEMALKFFDALQNEESKEFQAIKTTIDLF